MRTTTDLVLAALITGTVLVSSSQATAQCPTDLNEDGVVGPFDLALLLNSWGPCVGCAADLNADGEVDAVDLALLLNSWGPCLGCEMDADCDDGLFCNGVETCDTTDPENPLCADGVRPCNDTDADGNVLTCDDGAAESCAEDDASCPLCPGMSFLFTLEQDALTGTGGADAFNAPLVFHMPTGTNMPSLQTGDSANGLAGDDTLSATFNFAAATLVSPTLSAIEVFNVTDFGSGASTIIAGETITGMTSINISSSTNAFPLIFTDLATLPNVSLTNQAIGTTIRMTAAATAGNADASALTLSYVTAGTVTYTEGSTNGIETLNINSAGGANTLADIAMTIGTTLTTMNISGDQMFTLTASIDANVTTVDASASTGGSVITQNHAGKFTYTGGSGNDTIILGANYGATDTLDGGSGTDTLVGTTAALGDTMADQTNVTNFEALRISDAHTTVLNISHFGNIEVVTLDVGSNNGSLTNGESGINVSIGNRGGVAVGEGSFALSLIGASPIDNCTLTLNDAEQGDVSFMGCETLNLISKLDLDGSAANSGTGGQNTLTGTLLLTNTASQEKVVITGTEQMNIAGAITAEEIDASGMAEPFVMGAAPATGGITIQGGGGDDTLRGSAGADIIQGNAGNDHIRPGAASDLVTGAAGADMLFIDNAGAAGVDRNSFTDFDDTPTSGDQCAINIATTGVTLDGTDNFATSASIQTHAASGNLTVNAEAEVVVVLSAAVADFTSANSLNGNDLLTAIGGTITVSANGNLHLYAVANAAGGVGVYFGDPGVDDTGVVAAELTLVAVLQGGAVDVANLVFQNFANPNIP